MPTPFLSIIIPAYNEEQRLPATLKQVFHFLEAQPYTSEVLVVENASQDHTYKVALSYLDQYHHFQVLREPQRGKGMAVKRGMLEASGQYRFMCDADFSMPITEINRFLPPKLKDFDIAIASREALGAIRYNEPTYRHIVGRIFNMMIRLLVLPGLQDTQCGFKCFTQAVVEDLFPCLTISGWTFDVELLYVARKRAYNIVELPIPWYFNPESHVSVLKDSYKMALDLLQIRLNDLRGKYETAIKK